MPRTVERNWSPLVATFAFNLAGIALFFWLAARGWPGAPSQCLKGFICYCEQTQPGLARQPFNTWSNLAALPVVLLIAHDAARRDGRALRRLGFLFGVAASCQGLASMFFHGSLTTWGAVLDAVCIFFVVGLVLGVNLVRLQTLALRQIPAWLALCAAGALAYRLLLAPVMAPLFLLGGIAIIWTEHRARQHEAVPLAHTWFTRAMLLLGAAVVAWGLSLAPGLPLCSRVFPWGHALWHVLAALLTGALWLHAREALSRAPAKSPPVVTRLSRHPQE